MVGMRTLALLLVLALLAPSPSVAQDPDPRGFLGGLSGFLEGTLLPLVPADPAAREALFTRGVRGDAPWIHSVYGPPSRYEGLVRQHTGRWLDRNLSSERWRLEEGLQATVRRSAAYAGSLATCDPAFRVLQEELQGVLNDLDFVDAGEPDLAVFTRRTRVARLRTELVLHLIRRMAEDPAPRVGCSRPPGLVGTRPLLPDFGGVEVLDP